MSADPSVRGLTSTAATSAAPQARTGAAPSRRTTLVLVGLVLLALGACAAYLVLEARGSWDFVLPFRGRRLAALAVVGAAVAVSTVVFQTLTENRILTPSIMGFDALFVLIQSLAVLGLGSIALNQVPVPLQFGVEVVVMLGASTALFFWLFGGARRSLHLLVLVGVVFGVLFRSLSALVQRLIDPNEFAVLQSRLFASFGAVDPQLLAISAVVVAVTCAWLWSRRRELDVLLLGRAHAVALGVDHRRAVLSLLLAVGLLVSVSTALVGPITFFGLLVANLAYLVAGSHRHAVTLPVAVLLAVVVLVGGQAVLEHLLDAGTVLSVVVEFLGGIVFIALLVAGGRGR
ncbi:iron chelate uptake ABC transporter family permease subunit [Oerskovia flava]|uniref:iron chelate uptake ABC transporter family permease subunit n=1 Tax=Oerskovia flava TaxID=2986422 RepID=UPI00223F7945|nr:iron chelate uptake ABC transporter family permease subunit [Oerskovia sp. JB1-3-2]